MSLTDEFKKAAEEAKGLPSQSNETLLRLYALFKQAESGDISSKRPGMLDLRGRAKWDAWSKLKGTSQDEAMKAYIDLVSELNAAA